MHLSNLLPLLALFAFEKRVDDLHVLDGIIQAPGQLFLGADAAAEGFGL